ncbi:MAG: hypothetical protein HY898_00550 [Deltaproteobacteria bacterium]|nr:hypothetical protein [Deltaproteobacteria bacterium]
MGPTSSTTRATQVWLSRVLVVAVAFAAALGCASIAGLESLEVASADASSAGGSAGDSASSTESGDSPSTGGHDASSGGAGGAAGTAGSSGSATGGASGTAGTAGAGGAAGSAGVAGSAGNQGCSGTSVCVPPPDGQWSNWSVGTFAPFVMSSCVLQPGVVTKYYDASNEPDAPPAQCSCGCAAPKGDCTSNVKCSPTTGCGMMIDVGAVSSACATYNAGMGVGACIAMPPTVQATCVMTPIKSVPQSGWITNASTCMTAPDTLPTCDGDGRCVAAATGGAQGPCISAKGDVPCPAAKEWGTRFLVYEGVGDTRDCDSSSCVCQPFAALCSCDNGCAIEVASGSCGGTVLDELKPDGSCTQLTITLPPQVGVVLQGANMPPNGQCAAAGESKAVGQVAGTTPVTVCCKP